MAALFFDTDCNFGKTNIDSIYGTSDTMIVALATIAGKGTVTTNGTSTLTGSGTVFLNTFHIGDTITVAGEGVRLIASISSDTVLVTTTPFVTSLPTLAYVIGGGARFPDPSVDGPYNCVWWDEKTYPDPDDDPNREIVRVTIKSGDTFTVSRAQENTLATTKNTFGGLYSFSNVLTKFVMDQLRTALGTGGNIPHLIADHGTIRPQEPELNFKDFFVVTDNPGNFSSDVTTDVVGLANNSTFITNLTNNSTFVSTTVNNINSSSTITVVTDGTSITGNGTTGNPLVATVGIDRYVKVDAGDTTAGYLNSKINIHSTDASVNVTKTITNAGGNEILDFNLTTSGGGGGGTPTKIDQTPSNGTYGLLGGTVNGSNTVFTVSAGVYATGKLAVYRNGSLLLQGASDDWKETAPGSGTFTFNIAPLTGNIITAVYLQVGGPTIQAGIQFDDETGAALGTSATANEVEVTGVNVAGSRVSSKVTYTVAPKVVTVVTTATPTINVLNTNQYVMTALNTVPTFSISGAPVNGQILRIRIKDDGTARALVFDSNFRAGTDLTLPSTTVISKTLYLGFIWNATDSKFDLVGKVGNI